MNKWKKDYDAYQVKNNLAVTCRAEQMKGKFKKEYERWFYGSTKLMQLCKWSDLSAIYDFK